MNRITGKRAILTIACVVAVGIAAVAYAYFTSTGSGTATATVGTSSAVTIKGTVSGTLYPGACQGATLTLSLKSN